MPFCSNATLTEGEKKNRNRFTFNHLMRGESMEREEKIIEMLREKNWHFRHLEKLHGELDQSLHQMGRRRVLTPQEEVQKKEFQKKKLAAKDEMVEMVRQVKVTGQADVEKSTKRISNMTAGRR